MMNKSLALRNKIYRFCFLIFSFFLFIYSLFFLIYGEKGIFSYYNVINKHTLLNEKLILLENKNNQLEDYINRLNPNTIDLDYLDEKLRIKNGRFSDNELTIKLNK